MSTCETCRYWIKMPLQTQRWDAKPVDTGEHLCGKSRDVTAGIYGMDGKAVITASYFGCIHWKKKNEPL